MSIPFGYLQGNRSEYLAIPALTKIGFVIPVPRQEDHFGVDFVVHYRIWWTILSIQLENPLVFRSNPIRNRSPSKRSDQEIAYLTRHYLSSWVLYPERIYP